MLDHLPRMQARERILESAEALYLEHGINATSLRHITQAANVNLAAVNYYFGGKDGLTKAVFLHRYLPYARSCNRALDALPSTPELTDIINALLRPLEELCALPEQRGLRIINLLVRISNESPQLTRQLMRGDPTIQIPNRLVDLLQSALPHIGRQTLMRRIFIITKSLLYIFNSKDTLNFYNENDVLILDMPHTIAELRILIYAGLSAPVVFPPPPKFKNKFKINWL